MPTRLTELDISKAAVQHASQVLFSKKSFEVLEDKARDLKISLDLEVESVIRRELNSYGYTNILGEEYTDIVDNNKPFWVVDPIDGTVNFSKGIGVWAISLAYMKDKKTPYLGTVYSKLDNFLVAGEVGYGCFLDGNKVATSSIEKMEQSILLFGIPTKLKLSTAFGANMYELFSRVKKVRMIGSAATSLMQVALGRCEIYAEANIMLWDVAAGLALVKAAGGDYYLEETKIENCVNVVATNGKIDPIPIHEMLMRGL